MPSNTRAENQYYGKYFECCVAAHLNNSEVEYHEDYDFTTEEQKNLLEEAKIVARHIGNHTAAYLGNHTSTESGDIELDNGEVIELKRVSAGSGTYFNTSIYYFSKFGFDFKQYMSEYGLYDAIDSVLGASGKANRKNNSPVSQPMSSYIRHNLTKNWEDCILPVDKAMRIAFTENIADYFIHNPDKIYEFMTDMLNKNTATCNKTRPDRLIVFNYKNNSVREIDLKNFSNNITTKIRATENGLVIGNIRVAFSWQNGVGLNNPTIRVFLEE